jgi:hypothetical protein
VTTEHDQVQLNDLLTGSRNRLPTSDRLVFLEDTAIPGGNGRRFTPISRGDQFKYLTVQGFSRNKIHQPTCVCQCKCGNVIETARTSLVDGATKSCGCLREEKDYDYNNGASEASINALYQHYQSRAKKAKLSFKLTLNEFKALIQAPCCYCGDPPSRPYVLRRLRHKHGKITLTTVENTLLYNGVDRIDNEHGYWIGNVVSCCTRCNWAKGTQSLADFIAWALNKPSRLQQYSHILFKPSPLVVERIYQAYFASAQQRQIQFDISRPIFAQLIQQPCAYCNAPPYKVWKYRKNGLVCNGIDRINNAYGYTESNCAPCCHMCNNAKHTMPAEEFRQWKARLSENLKDKLLSDSPLRAFINN